MQTQEAIRARRSVRDFKPGVIPKEKLISLVEAGSLAPTARNVQPWEFVVVSKKETLEKIAQLAQNGRFLAQASCCIAVFSKDTKYYLEDCCAATQNILLMATDLGLASCWVAGDKKPYAQEINKLLSVPEGFKLVSLIALGYPEKTETPQKRPIEEILHWEKF